MFDPNFYPTPESVIYKMIYGLKLKGESVLEPSAGKGDIVEVLKNEGANVLACEFNDDLAQIVASKADRFVCQDFFELQSSDVSHIKYIIMNPPFDTADKHILHAVEIAPPGCEIVALCNNETYQNNYSRNRSKLKRIITDQGSYENLGDVFSDAERTTGIDIGLINIYTKPNEEDEFDGYFFSEEEERENGTGGDGLVAFSKIKEIVGRYVASVKMFDGFIQSASEINEMMKPIGGDFKIQFDTRTKNGSIYSSISRDEFKSKLQRSAWLAIFKEMNLEKYLTQKIIDALNKKLESQLNKPFTERNIYAIINIIQGTNEGRMKQVLIDSFDWITMHHNGNRHSVEGWKTNSMYYVGMKFIAPYAGVKVSYSGNPEFSWSSNGSRMDELVKALCLINGKNYDDCINLQELFGAKNVPNVVARGAIIELSERTGIEENKCELIHSLFKYFAEKKKLHHEQIWKLGEWGFNQKQIDEIIAFYQEKLYPEASFGEMYEYKQWGKWYDFNFFEIRVYKGGTLHAKFKDKKVWELFNRQVAKAKGWQLPERTGSDFRRKTTDIVIVK